MNEPDEPSSGVGGDFKSYVYKLIRIRNLIPCKKLDTWVMMFCVNLNK